MEYQPGCKPHEFINPAHLVASIAGKIFIHRDDMHTPAGQRVQVCRQYRNVGLPLSGFHLGNPALMQDYAAEQLNIKKPLAEHPHGSLASRGKGFGQKVIPRLAGGQPALENLGHPPQFGIAHGLVVRLEALNPVGRLSQLFYLPLAVCSEYSVKNFHLNLRQLDVL